MKESLLGCVLRDERGRRGDVRKTEEKEIRGRHESVVSFIEKQRRTVMVRVGTEVLKKRERERKKFSDPE